MELVRINEVVEFYGVSSRTLRYYEEIGLIWSNHPRGKAQRHYDAAALERLRQIIVLRKLQIPIKDIAKIYKSESTAALIRAFVDKLESLDTEISALSELRKLVDDFLKQMLLSGIKKISAITLLYEETQRRLEAVQMEAPVTVDKLLKVSRAALKLHDVRIIRLPPMRVLTSRLKSGRAESLDGGKMENLFAPLGFAPSPGLRNCFYRKEHGGEWIMLMQIPREYHNATAFLVETLPGGLFAVASSFVEDMEDTFSLLREWIGESDEYETDTERAEMIEEILPWDIANRFGRYQQDIFVPIQMK